MRDRHALRETNQRLEHLIKGGLLTERLGACDVEPSTPTTFPYTARDESLPARESSCIAARWPIGSALPPSTPGRWRIGWPNTGNVRASGQGFDGILQLDGYTGYNCLTLPCQTGGVLIIVAHCWPHARRKLKEIFDRDRFEIAAEGLRRIADLYRIEAGIWGMGPGQRLSARHTRIAQLVAAFGEWLQAQGPRVSTMSRLGKKLAYIQRHWDGLATLAHAMAVSRPPPMTSKT